MRNGDLDEFFQHKNQRFPPALSNMGKMRSGTKSDLVNCLEELVEACHEPSPVVDIAVLDGAGLVNMLRPGLSKTFSKYGNQVFLPYLVRQLNGVQRLDVVWDEYKGDSLKAETSSKRGKGIRRWVEASSCIPKNWHEFHEMMTTKLNCLNISQH